jgi:hypothetical protein
MKRLFIFISILAMPTFLLPDPTKTANSPFEALEIKAKEAKGFEILGFKENPSEQDLAKAYKKLAFKWHPDKNRDQDTNPVFDLIQAAKNNPIKTFHADGKESAQNYHTEESRFAAFGLEKFGIEKPDVIRAVKVLVAGAVICVLYEVRNFVKNRKNKKTAARKNTNSHPTPSTATA